MTKPKSEQMPAPDGAPALPRPPRPKLRAGYLVCEECDRVVPYQGLPDMSLIDTPQHRCAGHKIGSFTRWADDNPFRIPLTGEAS